MNTTTVKEQSARCRVRYRTVRSSVTLPALSEVFAGLESVSILGGNETKRDAGRFSYWAAEPKEIFQFEKTQKEPFAKLQKVLSKYKLESIPAEDLPRGIFLGGWVGYLSYELNQYIENLPESTIDDLKLPLIRLCFYDKIICYDHIEKNFRLIGLELPQDSQGPDDKLDELKEIIRKAEKINLPPISPADLSSIDSAKVKCNMSKEYYMEAAGEIKRYIVDGDVYQVNFSQRFESRFSGPPIELFHWQNYHNPNGYAAYIDAGDFTAVSTSPEMFITVCDGRISTKPIKGTRPRLQGNRPDTLRENRKNFNELQESEKEKAELNMIIDLERNDIARICIPGSRGVTQPRTIEEYPTIYHGVATVSGKLQNKISFCEITKALFPGGSITGAPKISAMKIIDRLEPTARSIYTGAIGFIGLDGNVSLNIAIRTVIIKDETAYAQTGGGIVADSDAECEWEETLTKATALMAGIVTVNENAKTN